jgi:hypothetical protein
MNPYESPRAHLASQTFWQFIRAPLIAILVVAALFVSYMAGYWKAISEQGDPTWRAMERGLPTHSPRDSSIHRAGL